MLEFHSGHDDIWKHLQSAPVPKAVQRHHCNLAVIKLHWAFQRPQEHSSLLEALELFLQTDIFFAHCLMSIPKWTLLRTSARSSASFQWNDGSLYENKQEPSCPIRKWLFGSDSSWEWLTMIKSKTIVTHIGGTTSHFPQAASHAREPLFRIQWAV